MRVRVLVRLAVLTLAVAAGGAASAAEPPALCLNQPVRAPVVDPFRAPGCRWCAGNRGIEYGTAAGTVVRAAAGGTVSFAGVVAGTRYVVVQHASGLRTTYGKLATIGVVQGATVSAGTPVGTTGGQFFFGVRRGDTYLDPAQHFLTVQRRARLVPTGGGPRLPDRSAVYSCAARGRVSPAGPAR